MSVTVMHSDTARLLGARLHTDAPVAAKFEVIACTGLKAEMLSRLHPKVIFIHATDGSVWAWPISHELLKERG